jgi:hypothetical protein
MSINDEYVARMETQLRQWDDGVDALSNESEGASADARASYHGGIRELRACREVAQRTFQELRVASESVGAQLQVAMQSAWESMQAAFERVSSEFRK